MGEHYRAADPRRLYSSGAGWPQLAENQFHVTPDPRIQAWGAGLKSRINALPPETRHRLPRVHRGSRSVPVVSHEIGQWCVYPNFDEMPKYTGYLKPRNFEIFRDTLQAHPMGDQAQAFPARLGQAPDALLQGGDRVGPAHPGHGGVSTARPARFPRPRHRPGRRARPVLGREGLCHSRRVPPLLRPDRALWRAWRSECLPRTKSPHPLEVAHFGPAPLTQGLAGVQVRRDDGKVYLAGHGRGAGYWPWAGQAHCQIAPSFDSLPAPARYKLTLRAWRATPTGQGLICENDWDIWIYPAHAGRRRRRPVSDRAASLNDTVMAQLNAGSNVLWLLPPNRVAPDPKLRQSRTWVSPVSFGTPPGPAAKRRTPWDSLRSQASALRQSSPPIPTATGNGGIWSPAPEP